MVQHRYRRGMPKVKLHRCPFTFLRADGHPCWKVQKALDEQGIDYELVKEPVLPGRRQNVIGGTGQRRLPVIEFEDGSMYRAESAEMAETVRSGGLFERAGGATPTAPGAP
jgi:hypothetical protein